MKLLNFISNSYPNNPQGVIYIRYRQLQTLTHKTCSRRTNFAASINLIVFQNKPLIIELKCQTERDRQENKIKRED